MPDLEVSVAAEPTDRTRAVLDGEILPGGIDLQPVPLDAAAATRRMVDHRDFDAAEIDLAAYLATADGEDPPFVGLPVFPGRSFVHSRVFVAEGDARNDLGDLAGATVGIDRVPSAAALWVGGLLTEVHEVPPETVSWVHAGGVAVGDAEPLPDEMTLADALAAGDVDAVVAAEPPEGAEPLYANPRATERDSYAETGHFPVITVVVLRRGLYERHPWVAQELYKAFDAAKDRCLEAIGDPALRASLPWLREEVAATRALMGEDYWPYGIDDNAATLEAAARYADELGLTARKLDLDDCFAPETFEAFKV